MSRGRDRWSRYPPLTAALGAVLLAAFVLPSALNVPLTNPTETLELAPVPPEDDDPRPTSSGNLASLSLGSSAGPDAGLGGIAGDGPGAGAIPPLPEGSGARPRTKRCVGNPPRQTEDPLSPPCVAHFEGENRGATYRGVTGDEIRVLFYFDGGKSGNTSGRGWENAPPDDSLFDLWKPQDPDVYYLVRDLINYQRYFNDRFQTYGRRAHFFAHFGTAVKDSTGATSWPPESRRADVSSAEARVGPFVVVSFARSNSDVYVHEWTGRGVVTFVGTQTGISSIGEPESFYRNRPGLAWSYIPSLDVRARNYVDYVCTKVLGHPVTFGGNGADRGNPRVLGLVRGQFEGSSYTYWGQQIAKGLEACGASFVDGALTGDTAASSSALTAKFTQAGVTTVLDAYGVSLYVSRAFAAVNYRPEIVLAGDDVAERPLQSRLQEQSVWQHVRAVSIYPRADTIESMPCFRAYREVDSTEGRAQVRSSGCEMYQALMQVFTAIQTAGPRLTPANIDRGLHAIPRHHSVDPYSPACFYEPGDYTCVKDAEAQWWDPAGDNPGSSSPGCMRLIEGGKRYLPGTWPEGDVEDQRRPDDPCNVQGADLG